jgi:hypothetical protein
MLRQRKWADAMKVMQRTMTRSTLFAGIALLGNLHLLAIADAIAHGDTVARYGGIAVASGEMTVEFVISPGKLAVHLNDHGDAVSVKGAEGTLVVELSDGGGRAIAMRLHPDDGFEVSDVPLKRGEPIKFFVKMPDGQVHVATLVVP